MTTAATVDAATAEIARRAVAEACAVCRRVQRDIDRVRAVIKDDRSPVTIADFASQAVIAHRLRGADSNLALVGEETSAALRAAPALREETLAAVRLVWPEATGDALLAAIDLASHPGGAGAFWTLDPIDGTKGFLRGQQYAVSLARIQSGQPALGVLGCPNLPADPAAPLDRADDTGVLYVATLGAGVRVWPATTPEGDGEPLTRPAYDPAGPLRLCESVEKAHSSHDATARILDHLHRSAAPARLDSQCKYAVVARGQADAYLRMPTKIGYVERIWDHAAGALVATESGCLVTDIRGASLDYSKGRGLESNLGVVCAAPTLHADLLGAIATLGLDRPPNG